MSRLEQLSKIVKEANEGLATYAEIKALVDHLVGILKQNREEMEQKMADNKAEMGKEVEKAVKEMSALEKRLTTLSQDLNNKQSLSLATAVKQLRNEISEVKELIPEKADLSSIYEDLEEIEVEVGRLTELMTSENIRNMLELLDGDERLDVSAIKGLEELFDRFEKLGATVQGLKGSASTPSPMHVPTHEEFTMNGVDTSVTLSHAVGAAGNAIFNATYQGQVLRFGQDYTVNGNKITFVGWTPSNGRIITVTYMP